MSAARQPNAERPNVRRVPFNSPTASASGLRRGVVPRANAFHAHALAALVGADITLAPFELSQLRPPLAGIAEESSENGIPES